MGLMSFAASADYITGDKIHFQANSTWVSAVYSRSLCHDGENFYATVATCIEYREDSNGDRECAKRGSVPAVQPMVSTRQRCAKTDDDDNDCVKYETVEYAQSPVRKVKFYESEDDDDGRLVKTETVIVPNCN